jgi:hypothetical protein
VKVPDNDRKPGDKSVNVPVNDRKHSESKIKESQVVVNLAPLVLFPFKTRRVQKCVASVARLGRRTQA